MCCSRRPYLTIIYKPDEPTINFRKTSYQNYELYDKLLKTHRSGTDMEVFISDPVKAEVYQLLGEHIGFEVKYKNDDGKEIDQDEFFRIFSGQLRELDILRCFLSDPEYKDSDVNPFSSDD